MKIRNSLKSLRGRHRDNQIVRRKGRVYVINKTQKRYKARQGLRCRRPPRAGEPRRDGGTLKPSPSSPLWGGRLGRRPSEKGVRRAWSTLPARDSSLSAAGGRA